MAGGARAPRPRRLAARPGGVPLPDRAAPPIDRAAVDLDGRLRPARHPSRLRGDARVALVAVTPGCAGRRTDDGGC